MPSKFQLCSFKTCPWVQRAAIVLRAKNVAYDITYVDLSNKPDWFLKLSPHGKVPDEILDSYPGVAYFDPRFHWTQLKVYTQPIPHNDPDATKPPLRKYEQKCLGFKDGNRFESDSAISSSKVHWTTTIFRLGRRDIRFVSSSMGRPRSFPRRS